MTYSVDSGAKIHINIMELLVQEEIERQLQLYPRKMLNYINKVEVATYALNRLPPLYASSFIGKEHQKRTGQKKHKSQINLAVRRALSAIERDPIRQSVPLISEDEAQYQLAKVSLKKLENLFKKQGVIPSNQELSWNKLNRIINALMNKAQLKKIEKYEKELEASTYFSNYVITEFSRGSRPSESQG